MHGPIFHLAIIIYPEWYPGLFDVALTEPEKFQTWNG